MSFPFTLLFPCAALPNSLDKDCFHILELIPFKSASKDLFLPVLVFIWLVVKKISVSCCANSSFTAVFFGILEYAYGDNLSLPNVGLNVRFVIFPWAFFGVGIVKGGIFSKYHWEIFFDCL